MALRKEWNMILKLGEERRNDEERVYSNPIEAQRVLWSKLKDLRPFGFEFKRRQAIGVFILDFYCHECRLAIEIDGGSFCTESQKEYKRRRQEYIELYGIDFLLFPISTIHENLNSVLSAIAEAARERCRCNVSIQEPIPRLQDAPS